MMWPPLALPLAHYLRSIARHRHRHLGVAVILLHLPILFFGSAFSAGATPNPDELFNSLCLQGRGDSCSVPFILRYCGYETPDEALSAPDLNCLVEGGRSLNLALVNCIRSNTTANNRDQILGHWINFDEGSGTAGFDASFTPGAFDSQIIMGVGASRITEPFDHLYIYAFGRGASSVNIDGTAVEFPTDYADISKALKSPFWQEFFSGSRLSYSYFNKGANSREVDALDLGSLRTIFEELFAAMRSCSVNAPDYP